MSYRLRFHELALAEWHKLDRSIRDPLKKKLAERLLRPRIASDALHGMPHHYKIKLRQVGYRLVYRVDDNVLTVLVVAVGRRDHSDVYESAKRR